MESKVFFLHRICLHIPSCGCRLTFWLSNTIISGNSKDLVSSNHSGSNRRRKTEGDGNAKIASSQMWKGDKNESTATLGYECFGNWDDPHVFISALEKVEAWIFSRIVESIWWQVISYSYPGPAEHMLRPKANSKQITLIGFVSCFHKLS